MSPADQKRALGIGSGTLDQKRRTHCDPLEPPQPVIVKDAPAFPIDPKLMDQLINSGAVVSGLGHLGAGRIFAMPADGCYAVSEVGWSAVAYGAGGGGSAFAYDAYCAGGGGGGFTATTIGDPSGAFKRAYAEAAGIAPDAAELSEALTELDRQREEHYRATEKNRTGVERASIVAPSVPPDKFAADLQEFIDLGVVIGVSDDGLDFKATTGVTYTPGRMTWSQAYDAYKVPPHAQDAQQWVCVASEVIAKNRAGEVTLWDVTLRDEPAQPDIMAVTRGMCK